MGILRALVEYLYLISCKVRFKSILLFRSFNVDLKSIMNKEGIAKKEKNVLLHEILVFFYEY